MADGGPICVRLDAELEAHVRARCAAEGLPISEVVRSLLLQWTSGAVPSVAEGYRQARGVGVALLRRLAHLTVNQIAASMPDTYEEALALLTSGEV